jgi:hypothetical protein
MTATGPFSLAKDVVILVQQVATARKVNLVVAMDHGRRWVLVSCVSLILSSLFHRHLSRLLFCVR